MPTGQPNIPVTFEQQQRRQERRTRRLMRQVRTLEVTVERLPRQVRRDWSSLDDSQVDG